jgi:hypothetical protein
MASNHKKKTTMAKMARENAVRERRLRKQARKDARKQEAAKEHANRSGDLLSGAPASPES